MLALGKLQIHLLAGRHAMLAHEGKLTKREMDSTSRASKTSRHSKVLFLSRTPNVRLRGAPDGSARRAVCHVSTRGKKNEKIYGDLNVQALDPANTGQYFSSQLNFSRQQGPFLVQDSQCSSDRSSRLICSQGGMPC